jgi:hypothetical protein
VEGLTYKPHKLYNCQKKCMEMDDFDVDIVFQTLNKFYDKDELKLKNKMPNYEESILSLKT